MAIVSQIEQDGVLYDVYDEAALHSADEIGVEGLENVLNKVTTIDEDSTDTQYPSAKAVWTLFSSILDVNEVEF